MYYTGIGSRETPDLILEVMKLLAEKLYYLGFTLRSGRAEGADQAFETGANKAKNEKDFEFKAAEIYLPWENFNDNYSTKIKAIRTSPQLEAMEIAKKFHPNWGRLTYGAKLLHGRNVHQILGFDVLDPLPKHSEFVICWTKDGKASGGTGQALRIAYHYGIKIYNLFNEDEYDKIIELILFENELVAA